MQWFIEQIYTREVILAFAPALLTGLLGILGVVFAARPRIQWAVQFQNVYRVQEDKNVVWVHTRDMIIKNAGRSVAEDVEFTLNYKPMHVALFPPVNHKVINQPDDRQIYQIERLNPQEFVLLSFLQTRNEVPAILSVRYKGGQGRQIKMVPMRLYSTPINLTVFIILVLGIYYIISLIVWLLAKIIT